MRLVPPRDGVDVEAVARIARPLRRLIDRQLERRHRRVLADRLRDELIGGRRQLHLDVRTRAVEGVHAGQPDRGRTRMIAGAVAERVGLQVRQAAQHGNLVADVGERREDRRQLEAGAGGRRDPLVLDDAVGDVDEADARRRLARRRQRRHHRIEHRQRHRRAHRPQERPPGKRFLGYEHRSPVTKKPRRHDGCDGHDEGTDYDNRRPTASTSFLPKPDS